MTTESTRMKRMQLNTDKGNQQKYKAAPNSKRKRLDNYFRFSQSLWFSMFSKESTKRVTMKLNFQTRKSQTLLNERQENNIHSLSLEKTQNISQRVFTLRKNELAVAQNKINLCVQILTAFVDPHFLNISGILSLDYIIYKTHKISYSHNREVFYD